MKQKKVKNITLLCKVVDNYGDIGVVYRLARSIKERENCLLRLIVDNLKTFKSICSQIDSFAAFQEINGIKVFDWNNKEICTKEFIQNPPDIILECFQCGRPEWLEDILFEKEIPPSSSASSSLPVYKKRCPVYIINIEYLTAESWANDFHLLKSGTRSPYIKKINFMPGFTKQTGGLILDNSFINLLQNKMTSYFQLQEYKDIVNVLQDPHSFNVLFFSYERDCASIIQALNQLNVYFSSINKYLNVFCASSFFLSEYNKQGKPFRLISLPFLDQQSWDALLVNCDFLFIRGEDSFSRACLSGIPFVWDIYKQAENAHEAKLKAFLDLLNEFFTDKNKKLINTLMLSYNNIEDYVLTPAVLLDVLQNINDLKKDFKSFASHLLDNGNLTDNLLGTSKNCNF